MALKMRRTGLLLLFAFLLLNGQGQAQQAQPGDPNPTVTVAPAGWCPEKTTELPAECTCNENLHQLRCTAPVIGKPLKLAKPYEFAEVIVEKVEDLAAFFEHSDSLKDNKLKIDTLTIQSVGELASESAKLHLKESLETLLEVSLKNLIINGDSKLEVIADNIQYDTLESIILKKVILTEVNFESLTKLTRLEMYDVEYIHPDLSISKSNLNYVRIERSKGLTGVALFNSDTCTPGEIIHIYLRENKFTSLNLGKLKLGPNGCHYYIDLSDSEGFDHDFLKNNQDLLKTANPGQLNFIMRGVPQTCTRCLYDLAAKKHEGFFHSIICAPMKPPKSTVDGKYLLEIPPTELGQTAECEV